MNKLFVAILGLAIVFPVTAIEAGLLDTVKGYVSSKSANDYFMEYTDLVANKFMSTSGRDELYEEFSAAHGEHCAEAAMVVQMSARGGDSILATSGRSLDGAKQTLFECGVSAGVVDHQYRKIKRVADGH